MDVCVTEWVVVVISINDMDDDGCACGLNRENDVYSRRRNRDCLADALSARLYRINGNCDRSVRNAVKSESAVLVGLRFILIPVGVEYGIALLVGQVDPYPRNRTARRACPASWSSRATKC